ncbi:ABC transporter substrate-binding protein [Curvibacter sp. RS43]|uniref:ABC transporter substrate-binding protein n=1 Tax=Curvibacter microcysteis TaxID=3026419 RepID=UPI00236285EC|nr:ABC transporter substrate-binding protein [Curvibacter sp. RS43]MDD0808976.1 ABC transporter substrate-binding protein [Curvibacter sp. RS43]
MSKKTSIALAALCALGPAAVLAPAQAQGSAGPLSDDKVRIGVLSDMSGLYADTAGKGSAEAARMAIEDFGGKVLGKPIELLMGDHQNKADIGASLARGWYDREGVDAIVDLNNSAVAVAVGNLARERNKMLLLTGTASVAMTNENCGPTSIHYVYDTYAMANGAAQGMLGRGAKSWFVVGTDYAFGKAMAANITEFVTSSGGKVLGSVFHPLNASDFSSFMLQAQASKADAIALANATSDTVNSIKSAREFGITKNQAVVPLLMFINDVHSLGLKEAQDMTFATAFYWDRTPESRAWSRRYFERMKKMPSMIQAGTYSAVLSYLKAIQAAGSDDGLTVAKKMQALPINDFFAQGGKVRVDGRMVHDMYLVQVKKPAESQQPWDYYKVLATIPGDQAFQPLSKSKCSLVTKS